MGGSVSLFFGSNISFDPRLQFLSRTEGYDTSSRNRNLFARFRIAPRALVLVSKVEVPETGQLHLLAIRKCRTHFFKKEVHQFARFALVEAQLIEERLRHLSLRESRHRLILVFSHPGSHADQPPRPPLRGPLLRRLACEKCLGKSSPKRRFFALLLCP